MEDPGAPISPLSQNLEDFDRFARAMSDDDLTLASELDLLGADSGVFSSSREVDERRRVTAAAERRLALREACLHIKRHGVEEAEKACVYIAAVIDDPQFRETEVQLVFASVVEALSKYAGSAKFSAFACIAMAKASARRCGSVAVTTKAVLAALREHPSSELLREHVVYAFHELLQTPRRHLSEILDQNGCSAIMLFLQTESRAHRVGVLCEVTQVLLAGASPDAGQLLYTAGIVDAFVSILRRFESNLSVEAVALRGLSACLERWPSCVDTLVQGGVLDLILTIGSAPKTSFSALSSAWSLFFSITDYREPRPEQLEAAALSAVHILRSDVFSTQEIGYIIVSAQVLANSCLGSQSRRKAAVSRGAFGGLVMQLRKFEDCGEELEPLLVALHELLLCKEARKAGGAVASAVLLLMCRWPESDKLQDSGIKIIAHLLEEPWFDQCVRDLCLQDKSGCGIVRVLFNFLQRQHSVDDCAEYAYRVLRPVVSGAREQFKGDEEWSRLQIHALQVLTIAMRAHLAIERPEKLLSCALALISLICETRGNADLATGEFPLGLVAVVVQCLRSRAKFASMRHLVCDALQWLLVAAPIPAAVENAFVLHENNTAEVLSSIICEEPAGELLNNAAYALSATVFTFDVAYACVSPRPLICDNVVPAVLRLLRISDLRSVTCRILHRLHAYSPHYRSQLASSDTVKALVKPLLSPGAMSGVSETYAALRLLVEADEACVKHALDADALKVKPTKSDCADRAALEGLLRLRRDADKKDADANANAMAAELLAEEEAEAAAKSAAQQKRKAKKKAPRAAAADSAAADADVPAPAAPAPEAEATAEAAAAAADVDAAGSQDGDAGASEASHKPRRKGHRGGGRKKSGKKGDKGDDDGDEAQQPTADEAADASSDAALAAVEDLHLVEEGFTAVETRKKGGRKQSAAAVPAVPPPPPAVPKPRPLPQPQPQPLPVAPVQQHQPAVPFMLPPLMSALAPPPMPVPMPLPPAQPSPPPVAAFSAPLLPWQLPQATRVEPSAAAQFSLFAQPQPPLPVALDSPPRAPPQPYRPPPPLPSQHADSLLPPSIFASLDEPPARLAPTPRADASASGLSNAAGEYNCFLNSIVQALFHVRCFRNHLLTSRLPDHVSNLAVQRSIALVSALGDLFEALQRGAALRRHVDAAPAAAAAGEAPVAPTALRLALAALNAGGAGEGAMNAMADAAEVLSALYDAFQAVSAAAKTKRAPDQTPIGRMFGFGVREAAHCTAQGCRRRVTHELSFRSFFHIVFSTALRDASATAAAQGMRLSFEELLAQLQNGDVKRCDKDVGGCGAAAYVRHELVAPPGVFTISLAWDTAQAAEDEVAATMKALRPELRPEQVFGNPPRDAARYELRAMVCYYGSHYAAYARTDTTNDASHPSTPEWSRFDDASVARVGSWEAVCDACARGHLQPTVLFYEKPGYDQARPPPRPYA